MRELIRRMNHQLCDNPVIEEQMRQLSTGAGNHHRKKAIRLSEETTESSGGHHRG